MNKSLIRRAPIVALVLVVAGSRRHANGQSVERPQDPTPSLTAADASQVRRVLDSILGNISRPSGTLVSFDSPQEFQNFVTQARRIVSGSTGGRTLTTINLGRNALAAIAQLETEAAGGTPPRVRSESLALLAQRTALLLASIVFEGQRIVTAPVPSKQSPMPPPPSKTMPQVPSKTMPQAPAKAMPQVPAKVMPPVPPKAMPQARF